MYVAYVANAMYNSTGSITDAQAFTEGPLGSYRRNAALTDPRFHD